MADGFSYSELGVKRMCMAMEIEMPVAGNGSMTVQTDPMEHKVNEIVTLGHRPSQLPRDFFVPVSQREKPTKKSLGDEVGKPTSTPSTAVEDGAKKKRGRSKKNSLDDELFMPVPTKDRPKKASLKVEVRNLNSTMVTPVVDGAERDEKPRTKLLEDCIEFFAPMSKKERPNKKLFGDEGTAVSTVAEDGPKKNRGRPRKTSLESEGTPAKGSPLGAAEDMIKRKRGRPKKVFPDEDYSMRSTTTSGMVQCTNSKKGDEGNIDNAVKPSACLTDAVITSGQDLSESRIKVGVIVDKGEVKPENTQERGTSLKQGDTEKQEIKTRHEESEQDAHGSGSGDTQLSQVIPCDDFFMPVSRRRKRKDVLTEEKVRKIGNAPAKPKLQKDGQAEKSPLEEVYPVTRLHFMTVKKKNSSTLSTSKEVPPTLPGNTIQSGERDLRLEAVLAAQEIARLNAGRMTHPFFARKKVSSLKTCVVYDETSTFQVEDFQPGPPIHVTQCPVDERTEVTWLGWEVAPVVNEGAQVDEFCNLDQKGCRLMQHPQFSVLENRDQRPDWSAYLTNSAELAADAAANMDETIYGGSESKASLKALQDLLMNIQISKSIIDAEGNLLPKGLQNVDGDDFSFENLQNRLLWYIARHDTGNSADNLTMSQLSKKSDGEAASSTRNLLWTDLYQPKSSKEVCGNATAVEAVSSWLYDWQQKISGQPMKGEDVNNIIRDKNADYDSDKGWFEDDSDIGSDLDDDRGLHNTLLVTGPEGCGKSAAVYACAGEQGFTVIEVNASDCRSGAIIKHKFGEAMESHGLGKVPQVGAESPLAAVKKAPKIQASSPGLSKQSVSKQKKAAAGTERVDRSPLKAHPDRPTSSQDEPQMDNQSKRKTVILFEDVDKHFEEDKGFLAALLQLSKTAKRPIILTSNRVEPGLPPMLEKCRIDFNYPTSDELVLHAYMVCIAEGLSCSPQFVERLVESCQLDLRKVMMALQFWGQGKAPAGQPPVLSRTGGSMTGIDAIGHNQHNTSGVSNKLSLGYKKSSSFPRSLKFSFTGIEPFKQWKSDARQLFELDVHHLILPKVISGSFVCPLSLLVGEKLCTAVRKLEEHAAQVAANESEERAYARHVELEASERMRKVEKKEKNALRRAFQSEPRVLEDSGGATNVTPDEDGDGEYRCGESWVCSPMKSLRKAKTLARSPLKSNVLKSRRALLLCDSDDEEKTLQMEPEGNMEAGSPNIASVDTNLPGVQITTTQSQGSIVDVVSENLEDLDVTYSPVPEVVTTTRRKRLSKKESLRLSHLMIPESLPGSGTVDIDSEVPLVKLKYLGAQADEIVSKWPLTRVDLAPTVLPADSDSLGVDQNDRQTIELNPSMSSDGKSISSFERGSQQVVQNFAHCRDQNVESILLPGDEQFVDKVSVDTPAVQLSNSREGYNHVNDSVPISAPVQQWSFEEVGLNNKDALLENTVIGQPEGLASEIMGPLTGISLAGHSRSGEGTVGESVNFSLSTVVDVDSQESKVAEESVSDSIDPVNDAWTSLRDSRETLKSLMNHDHRSGDITSSLADLLDVISVSDIISCVQTEGYKDAWGRFDGAASESFEGNIGHCSDWDACQEIASQLAHAGLQHSLMSLPSIQHSDKRLPVLSCILESAKDASAVGKCVVTYSGLTSELNGTTENAYARMNSRRQADRQASLKDMVQTAILPRGRVSHSGLVEYSSYLSRMSQLEEVRRTHGFTEGRRPRRFDHYLTSKLKSLSASDITELLMHSNFRNA